MAICPHLMSGTDRLGDHPPEYYQCIRKECEHWIEHPSIEGCAPSVMALLAVSTLYTTDESVDPLNPKPKP